MTRTLAAAVAAAVALGTACGPVLRTRRIELVPASVHEPAQCVLTKRGGELHGVVVGNTHADVVLREFDGNVLHIPWDEVDRVDPLPDYREETLHAYPSRLRLISSILLPGTGQLWYRGSDDRAGRWQLGMFAGGFTVVVTCVGTKRCKDPPANVVLPITSLVYLGAYLWTWIDAFEESLHAPPPDRVSSPPHARPKEPTLKRPDGQ